MLLLLINVTLSAVDGVTAGWSVMKSVMKVLFWLIAGNPWVPLTPVMLRLVGAEPLDAIKEGPN
jgi:hypothetical protein